MNILKKILNREFMPWKQYKAGVDFASIHYFQQDTRKTSIKNIGENND